MFDDFDRFCLEFWGCTIEAWQHEWLRPIVEGPIVISAEFLAAVPNALGAVTKMRRLNGHIIAETQSGIPMIVPQRVVRE